MMYFILSCLVFLKFRSHMNLRLQRDINTTEHFNASRRNWNKTSKYTKKYYNTGVLTHELKSESNVTTFMLGNRTYRSIYKKFDSHFDEVNDNIHWQSIIIETPTAIYKLGVLRRVAFMDSRVILSDTPCIRLLFILSSKLVSQTIEDKNQLLPADIFKLAIQSEDSYSRKTVYLSKYTVLKLSKLLKFVNDVRYREYLVSFIISDATLITPKEDSVKLSVYWPKARLTAHTITLMHTSYAAYTVPGPQNHNYCVCVKPLYGSKFSKSDEDFFIEWVEMNILLGVTDIHIYNSTWHVSERMNSILHHYKSTGLLKVTEFSSPFIKRSVTYRYTKAKMSFDYDVSNLMIRAAVNTYMYENMHRCNYIINLDIDEIIVPQQHSSYGELLKNISTRFDLQNLSSISAYHAVFYSTYNKTDVSSSLVTVQYRNYSRMFINKYERNSRILMPPFMFTKSFINPRYCAFTNSHCCTMGVVNGNKCLPSHLALTHHYRKDCKTRYCIHSTDDMEGTDAMLYFAADLQHSVNMVQYTILNKH